MFIASVLCQKRNCVVATIEICLHSVSEIIKHFFPNIPTMDVTSVLIPFSFSYQGGGWCNNVTTCLARKNSRLGSSRHMAKQIAFSGILNNRQTFNPGMAFNNSLMFVKSALYLFNFFRFSKPVPNYDILQDFSICSDKTFATYISTKTSKIRNFTCIR